MKCVSIFKLIKYIVALNKNSVFLYLFNKNNYNNYYSFFNYFISTVKNTLWVNSWVSSFKQVKHNKGNLPGS